MLWHNNGGIMSKADDDAARWMEMNRKAQYREWIKATEAGDAHYINEHGDVIREKEDKSLILNK